MHDPNGPAAGWAPNTPAPQRTQRQRSGRLALGAAGAAGAALVLAAVALLVSVHALNRSGTVPRTVAAGAPSATPAATHDPTVADSSSDDTGTDPAPTDAQTIDPKADYQVAYRGEKLRVQPNCFDGRPVDLDEPRVGSEQSAAELEYRGGCNGEPRDLSGENIDAAATVTSPDAAPQDCAEAIRTAPVTLDFPPSAGTNLCIVTSAEAAGAEGIDQKLALVTIDGIADDGTIALT
ncbi:MAG TPA: hypothetical protein VFX70_16810, partial [Mycobacteriales bacterium]|nr:hypothetical protein [Mycobacteriales bacterium]